MVTLIGESALRVWAADGLVDMLGNPIAAAGLDWSSGSAREIKNCCLPQLGLSATQDSPVHVLVDSADKRIQSAQIVSHVWSGKVPAGSLYRLAPGVLIASPAFCCLQDAARGSLPHVAATMMECMGLYGRVPSTRGFLDRHPLLSVRELESYLDASRGCLGVRKARRALRYALPRSRSPLETKVVLALTLPVKMGGYGLPRPELNYAIMPNPEEYSYSQFPCYEVDVCWPHSRTVLEVDSYANHMSYGQFDRDAMKRNSLKALGWKVSGVTQAQLSGDALDVLARQIAKDLGVRARQPAPERRDRLIGEIV